MRRSLKKALDNQSGVKPWFSRVFYDLKSFEKILFLKVKEFFSEFFQRFNLDEKDMICFS